MKNKYVMSRSKTYRPRALHLNLSTSNLAAESSYNSIDAEDQGPFAHVPSGRNRALALDEAVVAGESRASRLYDAILQHAEVHDNNTIRVGRFPLADPRNSYGVRQAIVKEAIYAGAVPQGLLIEVKGLVETEGRDALDSHIPEGIVDAIVLHLAQSRQPN